MTPDEFRTLGHAMIDWIADYRTKVGGLPVMSRAEPGEVRARFPASPPEAPEPLGDVLAEVDRSILPGITHWNHPSFFAYFPS
ncbi:aspartate aminotransferase family protein, partial [Salmonella enterica subsp. enterica serovar Kentucky]|nr:aspartate aminotransferase family protein [Salmonella enterica subsp. enterica serovar Kentucky]